VALDATVAAKVGATMRAAGGAASTVNARAATTFRPSNVSPPGSWAITRRVCGPLVRPVGRYGDAQLTGAPSSIWQVMADPLCSPLVSNAIDGDGPVTPGVGLM